VGRDGSCRLESRQDQPPSVFTRFDTHFHEPPARYFKSSLLGFKLTADPGASIATNRPPIPIGLLHAGFI
jgi:hypothetical protein